jgi:hypothetical protein
MDRLKIKLTAYDLRLTTYGLRLTAYDLRLTAYGLRLTALGTVFPKITHIEDKLLTRVLRGVAPSLSQPQLV